MQKNTLNLNQLKLILYLNHIINYYFYKPIIFKIQFSIPKKNKNQSNLKKKSGQTPKNKNYHINNQIFLKTQQFHRKINKNCQKQNKKYLILIIFNIKLSILIKNFLIFINN
ncbi:hypothetical protein PPERSA_01831 [Pseudocohnilembus persalinus]|uniref:Transmembrane protein n=1 Tax=Pseudocohnilembus persalinus TaxID=266149 RepID=A0A0V0QKQ4_PSEPJ|nr:hypothetical protein PPERSA_01831 [Pseudocohnilembus persalinus]|eukprot:KRX02714.1 hypothetical protein PPERSA_01831 [Pseudocohnilembus persalinus]